MTAAVDIRLNLIVDCQCGDALIAGAVAGGVTLVQLRDKTAGTRAYVSRARQLQALLTPLNTKLLINDRVDVALASGAAGVHLGQQDMDAEDARALLGDNAIIGVTARCTGEVDAAPIDCIDYLSIGGVYSTVSKHNTTPPIGTGGLRSLVARARERGATHVMAIAGINAGNIDATLACGIDGVAVISAVTAARDPQAAATALREHINRFINSR